MEEWGESGLADGLSNQLLLRRVVFMQPDVVAYAQDLYCILDIQKMCIRDRIWRAYLNTIIYLILGTFISTFMTLSAGYALSRKDLKFRSFIMVIFTLTMFFNGGMIPRYLLVKNLGLTDTIWCMVLPNAVSIWNLIIARTFFSSSLPVDLLEAAKIDGCNDIKFFFKIALPLSSALTMVMVLFYGVGIRCV